LDKKIFEQLRNADDPWIRLRVLKDLDGLPADSDEVKKIEKETVNHPLIKPIIDECNQWPGYALKSHKDAKHIVHKISLLADLGLDKNTPGIPKIAEKLMDHQTDEGAFQTLVLIPKVFGGTDKPDWNWMLCDLPLIVYTLLAFGYKENSRVKKAADFIQSLISENGWPCRASLPKFKGPGKREDPCPFANLISLKTLSLQENSKDSRECRIGAEMLLSQWQDRKKKRYFLFAMGSKFLKLKYPFVWYDLLHVVEVLSRFEWIHGDRRFQEMASLIFSKADPDGLFTPESVWMAFKGFDFSQKKIPSLMLTLSVLKIRSRIG